MFLSVKIMKVDASTFQVEQLHKIFKLCGSPSKDYWKKLHLKQSTSMKPPQSYERCLRERYNDIPRAAVDLMDTLLSIDPTGRGTAASALDSEVHHIFSRKHKLFSLITVFVLNTCQTLVTATYILSNTSRPGYQQDSIQSEYIDILTRGFFLTVLYNKALTKRSFKFAKIPSKQRDQFKTA